MGQHNWSDTIKHVMDGISVATAVGTVIKMLPAIAALFSIIWSIIRIYETKTVQKLLGKGAQNG